MPTFKQTVIELVSDDTTWYMHFAIWCYIFNTTFIVIMLPTVFGLILQQSNLEWEIIPQWASLLWSHVGWMMKFLAGVSIIDIAQKVGILIYTTLFEEKDVL